MKVRKRAEDVVADIFKEIESSGKSQHRKLKLFKRRFDEVTESLIEDKELREYLARRRERFTNDIHKKLQVLGELTTLQVTDAPTTVNNDVTRPVAYNLLSSDQRLDDKILNQYYSEKERRGINMVYLTERLPEMSVSQLVKFIQSARSTASSDAITPLVESLTTLCSVCVANSQSDGLQRIMFSAHSILSHFCEQYLSSPTHSASISELVRKVHRFLLLCHMKHEHMERFVKPTYEDIAASLLSLYIDLTLCDPLMTTDEAQAYTRGVQLCTTVCYLLGDRLSAIHRLDTLLQLSVVSTPTRVLLPSLQDVLTPLVRKVLGVVPQDCTESVIYSKYISAVRLYSVILVDIMQPTVQQALRLPAPRHYIQWLRSRNASIIDELPTTRKFRGTRVTRFLLTESSPQLINNILDLLVEDNAALMVEDDDMRLTERREGEVGMEIDRKGDRGAESFYLDRRPELKPLESSTARQTDLEDLPGSPGQSPGPRKKKRRVSESKSSPTKLETSSMEVDSPHREEILREDDENLSCLHTLSGKAKKTENLPKKKNKGDPDLTSNAQLQKVDLLEEPQEVNPLSGKDKDNKNLELSSAKRNKKKERDLTSSIQLEKYDTSMKPEISNAPITEIIEVDFTEIVPSSKKKKKRSLEVCSEEMHDTDKVETRAVSSEGKSQKQVAEKKKKKHDAKVLNEQMCSGDEMEGKALGSYGQKNESFTRLKEIPGSNKNEVDIFSVGSNSLLPSDLNILSPVESDSTKTKKKKRRRDDNDGKEEIGENLFKNSPIKSPDRIKSPDQINSPDGIKSSEKLMDDIGEDHHIKSIKFSSKRKSPEKPMANIENDQHRSTIQSPDRLKSPENLTENVDITFDSDLSMERKKRKKRKDSLSGGENDIVVTSSETRVKTSASKHATDSETGVKSPPSVVFSSSQQSLFSSSKSSTSMSEIKSVSATSCSTNESSLLLDLTTSGAEKNLKNSADDISMVIKSPVKKLTFESPSVYRSNVTFLNLRKSPTIEFTDGSQKMSPKKKSNLESPLDEDRKLLPTTPESSEGEANLFNLAEREKNQFNLAEIDKNQFYLAEGEKSQFNVTRGKDNQWKPDEGSSEKASPVSSTATFGNVSLIQLIGKVDVSDESSQSIDDVVSDYLAARRSRLEEQDVSPSPSQASEKSTKKSRGGSSRTLRADTPKISMCLRSRSLGTKALDDHEGKSDYESSCSELKTICAKDEAISISLENISSSKLNIDTVSSPANFASVTNSSQHKLRSPSKNSLNSTSSGVPSTSISISANSPLKSVLQTSSETSSESVPCQFTSLSNDSPAKSKSLREFEGSCSRRLDQSVGSPRRREATHGDLEDLSSKRSSKSPRKRDTIIETGPVIPDLDRFLKQIRYGIEPDKPVYSLQSSISSHSATRRVRGDSESSMASRTRSKDRSESVEETAGNDSFRGTPRKNKVANEESEVFCQIRGTPGRNKNQVKDLQDSDNQIGGTPRKNKKNDNDLQDSDNQTGDSTRNRKENIQGDDLDIGSPRQSSKSIISSSQEKVHDLYSSPRVDSLRRKKTQNQVENSQTPKMDLSQSKATPKASVENKNDSIYYDAEEDLDSELSSSMDQKVAQGSSHRPLTRKLLADQRGMTRTGTIYRRSECESEGGMGEGRNSSDAGFDGNVISDDEVVGPSLRKTGR